MSVVITAAAALFAVCALILHRAVFQGPFVEPALLLTMGSFFILAARFRGPTDRSRKGPTRAPVLVRENSRASA
jgi:hypothetical protein